MYAQRTIHNTGAALWPRLRAAIALTLLSALICSFINPTPLSALPLPGKADPNSLDLRLIAINGLHGTLAPPQGPAARVTRSDGAVVEAGGAAYLAAYIKQLQEQTTHSLLYSVGDNVGASPLESGLFHDEPTINFLNSLGLAASAIGNSELDEGYSELLRLQHGGCHPQDGCNFDPQFSGSTFPLLAANLTRADGAPATMPFSINLVDGVPVGVIGVTPSDSPTLVAQSSIKGLSFGNEVETINRTADVLDFFGIKIITLLLHKPASVTPSGPNTCNNLAGPAKNIAEAVSPKIDVLFSADSQQQYNCTVTDPAGQPRTLIQGSSNGRMISVVDTSINPTTGDVIRSQVSAFNQVVSRDIEPDQAAQAIVDAAIAKAAPLADRPIGITTSDLTRKPSASGETTIANLVAESHLYATTDAGAQLALTNPGGVRADLLSSANPTGTPAGTVTYAHAYAVQPWGNTLRTISLTGAEIKMALEQQYRPSPTTPFILGSSANLRYTVSESAPVGSKVSALMLNGIPLDLAASYRVTVNSFLAEGGDGFTTFTAGRDSVGSGIDTDALVAYINSANPIVAPDAHHISVID
ncbi:MAG: bifunctional metallophosphatase/5'-nucleotidase [Mycobacteriaceae bacterium]